MPLLTLDLSDIEATELMTATLEFASQGSPFLTYRKVLEAIQNPANPMREDIQPWQPFITTPVDALTYPLTYVANYRNVHLELAGVGSIANTDIRFGLLDGNGAILDFFSIGANFGGASNWLSFEQIGSGTYNYLRLEIPRIDLNSVYFALWYTFVGRRAGSEGRRFTLAQIPMSFRVYLASGQFGPGTEYRLSGEPK